MYPAIFLDRDGVIIENKSEYVRDWSHVKIFPEAVKALAMPELKNYKFIIVTNQSVVGKGIISLEVANDINKRLIDVIHAENGNIDGVYLCPHEPKDQCNCRKPKPGLLLQAAQDLSLDLKRSWMVGDAWTDLQAGQSAGIKGTIIVKTGRGSEQLLSPKPASITNYTICKDLSDAFKLISETN